MDAVVFDWDGTLVDTLGALYRANESVLAGLGLPFDLDLYRQHYAPDWRLMYQRLGVPADRLDEANEQWLRAFDGAALGEPFPGTVEAVGRLATAGMSLGLVTAGDRDIVEGQLARSGLADYLTVRIYGDDLPVHKPDPRPLREALIRLDLADRPNAAAYVGDAPDDMRMARIVGVRGVGISSVLGSPDELRAAGATDVAPTVAAWVEELLGPAARAARQRSGERT